MKRTFVKKVLFGLLIGGMVLSFGYQVCSVNSVNAAGIGISTPAPTVTAKLPTANPKATPTPTSVPDDYPTDPYTVFPVEKFTELEKKLSTVTVYDDKTETSSGGTTALGTVGISAKTVGTYPTRKGVILVTSDAYRDLIPTGHAAIIYKNDKVVESMPNGVTTGKNDWNTSKKTTYACTPKKTLYSQDKIAADYCYDRIGKPYNWNYFNIDRRNKFYCSHLIYAAFLDKYNINLNTSDFSVPFLGNPVHPLELASNNYVYLIYSNKK